MAEYTEDCCFNYDRDHCKGDGCPCKCHEARSVMRTKHESDDAFLDWVGESVGALCTHTVQAAFRGGWEAARAALDSGAMPLTRGTGRGDGPTERQ